MFVLFFCVGLACVRVAATCVCWPLMGTLWNPQVGLRIKPLKNAVSELRHAESFVRERQVSGEEAVFLFQRIMAKMCMDLSLAQLHLAGMKSGQPPTTEDLIEELNVRRAPLYCVQARLTCLYCGSARSMFASNGLDRCVTSLSHVKSQVLMCFPNEFESTIAV